LLNRGAASVSESESEITFRFGVIDAILADLCQIPSASRSAFAARLKNYHRLGFPKNIGAGRGRAVSYSVGELLQMAVAVELTGLGLLPERAIEVIEADPYPMHMALMMGASALLQRPPADLDGWSDNGPDDPLSMFLYFDPSALSPWSEEGEDWASATFFYGGIGIVRENLIRWTTGPTQRLALINVTAMLWRMAAWFGEQRTAFLQAACAWADTETTKGDFDLDAWISGPVRRQLMEAMAAPVSPPNRWVKLSDVIETAGLTAEIGSLIELPSQDRNKVPSMIIYLPGQRELIADAKVIHDTDEPLSEIEAAVKRLTWAYRTQFTDSTRFSLLYVPDSRMMFDAMAANKRVWDWALEQGVVIVTPETFPTLLAAARQAWVEAGETPHPIEISWNERTADTTQLPGSSALPARIKKNEGMTHGDS
jgi:hypothetical protein